MTTLVQAATVRLICHLQQRDENNNLEDVNIAGADVLKVCLKKPDNTVVEFDGTLFSDGSDGSSTTLPCRPTWIRPEPGASLVVPRVLLAHCSTTPHKTRLSL